MDVSTWFALRDLRKEARFGVNASEEDGIVVEIEERQGAPELSKFKSGGGGED